jgi:hypothetical protein
MCGDGMAENQSEDEEHPKWPDWLWVALLVLTCALGGFVVWQERTQEMAGAAPRPVIALPH